MRRIIGTIGATLAIVVLMAASAAPANTGFRLFALQGSLVPPDAPIREGTDLRLPVEPGDAIGFLATREVDLGTRPRPQPDGAVQSFTEPCAPCGLDGGTGHELLFGATVEPDDDGDGLGDESQDPDLGFGDELLN